MGFLEVSKRIGEKEWGTSDAFCSVGLKSTVFRALNHLSVVKVLRTYLPSANSDRTTARDPWWIAFCQTQTLLPW